MYLWPSIANGVMSGTASLVRHPRSGKTTVGTADSQGSLPKTAASTYLDDNAVELSLCRGLLPAASL
jgi:hypothetical protein